MRGEVNLSVRALVEYAYRSGSIESGFRTAASLAEGTKAHKQVQSGYGEEDEKEGSASRSRTGARGSPLCD